MQCNTRKDLFTSLVGTVPLNDVLADLPLPTPLPTPMEDTVLGMRKLNPESKKLLDSTNLGLCSRITEALMAVDTSFLELKESCQTVPYTPSARDPPLIKAVMTSLLPQAVVKVERLDPSLLSISSNGVAVSEKQDAVVPEVSSETKFFPGKRRKRRREASGGHSKRSKLLDSSSDDEPTKVEVPQAQPPAPPTTAVSRIPLPSSSLCVSIDRYPIQAPPPQPPTPSLQPLPKRHKKPKKPKDLPPICAPLLPSFIDAVVDPILIRFPRQKLKGYFGLPYSGAVYGVEEKIGKSRQQPAEAEQHGLPRMDSLDYEEFAVVPGAEDHSESSHVKKKKKKRHSHHRGDQNKAAHLSKFVSRLEVLFDQNSSFDDLLSQVTLSELLANVTNLKQMGILHEVAVEHLVHLITFMDKHVLDAASLQINEAPEGMERGGKSWRETARDRILCSLDAALVVLQVVTAPHMPKKVHMEESIDQILALTKFHLDNNVYPQFDPVYKAEKKDSGSLPRQKRKSSSAQGTTNKFTNAIYYKLTEVVENMATLTEAQPLTDTTILMLSSMGTLPFFVENVPVLQLSALRLVRSIFTRYDKHRDLILDEVFASLQKLPSNKRNLRTYKLSSGQHIQMLSALVLQLVQCTVTTPTTNKEERDLSSVKSKDGDKAEGDKARIVKKSDEVDTQMTQSYNLAVTTGSNFLSKFLKKCCSSKDEDDFKPLFENFIQDLLTTLNLPLWPASEVLLTLLGNLLVQTFSNRSMDQSLRLMSLEHLGVIAARLRKDSCAPKSEQENEQLVDIIAQVMELKMEANSPSPTAFLKMDAFSENKQYLQKVLVAYLNKQAQSDPASTFARDFYIGQWLYDSHLELEKLLKDRSSSPTAQLSFRDLADEVGAEESSSNSAVQQCELKKEKILVLLDSHKNRSFLSLAAILSEGTAHLVSRHLASSRALTKSFDLYLNKLMTVSNEPAVHVRTRALKALSSIIAADPNILSRHDMQRAVEIRFRDTSTLVREAAVDVIGRFVLCKPELTLQYYDMICERIRDSGVSVRKRVIKILKDVCVLQPDFPKITDIYVRILRRISDEEAIKQLVTSVFRELWFAPVESHSRKETLLRRVTNITAVVGICKDYEWFEQLLEQILKNEDQASTQALLHVCQMMVDTLVENVLTLDAKATASTGSLMSCIITLYLFCNVKPSLLLNHATTLHPYLGSCAASKDMMVLHYVAKILKEVVPLMEHPSQSFLAALEEDLVKLIMKHGQLLIHSSVECLGVVVNSVTKNYSLVKDCFQRFFKCLEQMKAFQSQNPGNPQLKTHRHSLLRSLFTVGVLCKFFNFDSIMDTMEEEASISTRVYDLLMFFFKNGDAEIQIKTVKGLGLFCIRYPEMMLQTEMRELISEWLTKDCASTKKIEVLRNLHNYLKEVELQLKAADIKWEKEGTDKAVLLELGDTQSSVSSNIAQAFLHQILEAFLHTEIQVRFGALQAVVLILRQGLVHPAQCVPYLMAMSTDPDSKIKAKADQHLIDHTSRYGHLMQTQLLAGVRKSYEFQKLIAGDGARGFVSDNTGNCSSVLSHVYTLVRSSKQQRRLFLTALLRHFEDYEKNVLGLLLYLADTLAFLPYNTIEEPLFVVHHVDMTISITGSNLLQQFRESLCLGRSEDDDDPNTLYAKDCNVKYLSDCCFSSQGCYLLLLLKQNLKKSFGLSDSKCQKYSPTESNKANDKTANRKGGVTFEPEQVLHLVRQEAISASKPILPKEECIRQYLEFKQLMNKLDPFDGDDNSDQDVPSAAAVSSSGSATALHGQKVEELTRLAVNDRSSRASSINSMGSRREKKERGAKSRRKKKVVISSDSSDDDGDPTWS